MATTRRRGRREIQPSPLTSTRRGAATAEFCTDKLTASFELLNAMPVWRGKIRFVPPVLLKGSMILAYTDQGKEIRFAHDQLQVFAAASKVIFKATNKLIPTPPQKKIRAWWEPAAQMLVDLGAQEPGALDAEDPLRPETLEWLQLLFDRANQPVARCTEDFVHFMLVARNTPRDPNSQPLVCF